MKKLSLILLVGFMFFVPVHQVNASTIRPKPFYQPLVYEYHFSQSGHYFILVVSTAPPPNGHVTQAYISSDGINYYTATFGGGTGTAILDPSDSYALNLNDYEVSYSGFGTYHLDGTYYPF